MGSSQPQIFSVRIVSIDYHMAPPIPGFDTCYSSFHGGNVKEVPVIRIYGSTPAGQKTCLHVHQVLPYLYVPISDLGLTKNDDVDSCMHSVSLSLERALKLKGNAGSKKQHVHGCNLVRAKKFYGYHSSEELFVKIYFYYPQDVSRAANLLLEGVILDKILQPYESHIPFLLQFSIDYNLYGMGHLHVSKIKFRPPVPDVYSHRKVKYNSKLKALRDDSTCMDSQADLGGNLSLDSPIWISSTIPDEWIWPHQPSSSVGKDNPLFKRQSTSELEADAAANDILNQQSISYVSMSQTHSNTKMVQSLIPIWEEEYERNGTTEFNLLDPDKPQPQDVLRNLLGGAEFEKLVEVDDSDNLSLLTPESVKSSAVCRDFLDLEESNYLKASDKVGPLISLSSPIQIVDDKTETNEIDRSDQLQVSGNAEPSTPKDEDVLRLLKWLASSQAAEEINSDDELAHQTILSPLIPSKGMDKVLERANIDYESESQKECQDILDSIDMLNNEEANNKLFSIPQVDGSSDDLPSTPCSDESLKSACGEIKSNVEAKSSNSSSKYLSRRPRWGSLPVCSQKMSESSPPNTSCGLNEFSGKIKGVETSCSGKKDVCHTRQASAVVECSTRDLMRRKRSSRVGLVDYKSSVEVQDAELCSNAECMTGNMYSASKLSSSENRNAITSPANELPAEEEAQRNINSTIEVGDDTIHINSPLSDELHRSSNEGIDASDNTIEAESVKLIATTISKKPPTIDWKDEGKNEVPLLVRNGGTSADDVMPFFERDCLETQKSKRVDEYEKVMGVPIIYQNDGSCLYMLTPAKLPPSRQSVERWLSSDSSDVFSHKIDSPSRFLPIPEGLPGDMVNSQGSQTNSGTPMSISDKKPNPCEDKALTETKRKIEAGFSPDISQISGPDKKMRTTPLSQMGFRDPASVGQGQQLTLLSVEIHANSRGDLKPDPRFDAINFIVLVLQEDEESMPDIYVLLRCCEYVEKDLDAISESKLIVFSEELQLFNHFMKLVHSFDPDIVVGWDVQSGSIGFLAERAAILGVGLLDNISRTPSQINIASADSKVKSVNGEIAHLENSVIEDEWGRTHASGVHVGGRIVLNIWRLMRHEVKLNIYTIEAVAESVLRRKIPYIPFKVLTKWFSSGPGRARYKTIDYIKDRAKLNLQILNQLDLINRTSELARVFGIDFFSVLSRGSQYRVESMFLRLAHTQNYLAISPGNQQVANQPAMECIPLVMEPESRFYKDPVVVLDFQSLYPSMVIAYNLCFCTCLGKIMSSRLGVSSYSPDSNILRDLKDDLLVAPNGVAYVNSKVRKGILPRLLEELLSTRIMVKQAMKKLAPSEIVRNRILNARQLALKLIANVTYGYTAAGFSGRMPCAELADSIVQCGRRTLEAAISFVNSNEKWKARVIYGDTDSMFVLLKGRSLQEAFEIGREIASAITEMNPTPVTLKMEKVYYPCFLLTKKRYVGYSYESPDQSKPIFDAKGIETIRRDTCAAVSKTMEQSLRTYFESQDINKVRAYVIRQWTKILSGRVSIQDFVFAKEVRLGTYATSYSLPPAAIVATKSLRVDPRAEPRYAERIPYVVIHGEPGARLADMVVDPFELLSINSPFRLNDVYYIQKQIMPALQRVFGLVGADLNQWFLDMPRPVREGAGKRQFVGQNPQRMRIDYYYGSRHCVICGDLIQGSANICRNCSENESVVAIALTGRSSKLEKEMHHLAAICRHCGGGDWLIESGVKCTSLACSVFYERMKVQKELQSLCEVATATGFYPKCMVEWF